MSAAESMAVNLSRLLQAQGMCTNKPASAMVRCALDRWSARNLRADNTSVIVVMIDSTEERRKRSGSSASTVSINSTRVLSESEDETSESEMSDSDLIDSFAPDIDMDEEDPEAGASLPCFDGVGLERTPSYELTKSDTKPRLRRIGSLKKLDSNTSVLTKVAIRKPVFTGRLQTPGSAPPNLNTNHFRGIVKSSPFARNRFLPRSSPVPQEHLNGGSNASFMDPGFKSPAAFSHVKANVKAEETGNGASPVLANGERTLRPKSPRLFGENVLPSGSGIELNAGASGDCNLACSQNDTASAAAKAIPVDNTASPITTLNFGEPKEATSPKSPLKIEAVKGSPSAGLVSPIWPSNLEIDIEADIALNEENVLLVPESSIDSESTENIEHRDSTPKKSSGHTRRVGSASKFAVKRLKANAFAKMTLGSSSKHTVIRTRGQLKSLSPQKNSSPRKAVTPRKNSGS